MEISNAISVDARTSEAPGQVRAIHSQLQGLVVGINPMVIAPQDTERQKEQPKLKFACYRSSWFAHVPTRLIWSSFRKRSG